MKNNTTHFDHEFACKCGIEVAVESIQLVSTYRKYSRSMKCRYCGKSVYGKRREYHKRGFKTWEQLNK